MNYLDDFKTFYLQTVLPNIASYQNYFGTVYFDDQINKLIEVYKSCFGSDPFDVVDIETSIAFSPLLVFHQQANLLKLNLSFTC